MELSLSREDTAFRDAVRAFIAENYPREMRVPNPETDLTKEQSLLWHRVLYRKGWIAPLWPREYGGPGWSIMQRFDGVILDDIHHSMQQHSGSRRRGSCCRSLRHHSATPTPC